MQEKQLPKDRETISAMFDSIAESYDKLNHILSFGLDRMWRKKLVGEVVGNGAKKVLDVACGSGDVAIALYNAGMEVTGVDISGKMLNVARKKSPEKIEYMYGDASELPFKEESFDCITIAYGIRNFDKLDKCMKEFYRIVKKGGSIQILEFGIPDNAVWRAIYSFYFKNILPVIGRSISGNKSAYQYLPESSFSFPYGKEFCKVLSKGGFRETRYKPLTGGVSFLYAGKKQYD